MIEAVLFDNDGVLVDTERLYFEAARVTLAEIGIQLTLGGLPSIEAVRRSVRHGRAASRRGLTKGPQPRPTGGGESQPLASRRRS
jgi:beta-phosphoglucomutase-like phosphatase (HAD superfamily)